MQTTLPISFFNFGLYGQDEWRARPNLTLTLALRAEHYSNPSAEPGALPGLLDRLTQSAMTPAEPYNRAILINQKRGFEGVDNGLWSPRFSFAWQPFGISHDTVLRLGFGVFYNPIPNGITGLAGWSKGSAGQPAACRASYRRVITVGSEGPRRFSRGLVVLRVGAPPGYSADPLTQLRCRPRAVSAGDS